MKSRHFKSSSGHNLDEELLLEDSFKEFENQLGGFDHELRSIGVGLGSNSKDEAGTTLRRRPFQN